jgi:membrane associated rhomboid family serine protease
MGIYDRDYYRDRRGLSAFDARVQACVILVGVWVALFLFQAITRDNRPGAPRHAPITELLDLDAGKVLDGEIWRVVTYSFLHDPIAIWPIFLNSLLLIWFGRAVEDRLGWKEFLAFYFVATALAGVGFVLIADATGMDRALTGPACAVTAILLLYCLHDPRRTVLLFFVLPCPVWLIVVFHVVNSVAGFVGRELPAAIFAAHAIAAGFAFVYYRYTLRITQWLPGAPTRSERKTKLHIFQGDGESERGQGSPGVGAAATVGAAHYASGGSPAPAAALLDEHLEAKLDEVLEKVKKHGQDSLTQEERAVLFRASEIYRKRRKPSGD